jgi:putative Holliday junction resolvase
LNKKYAALDIGLKRIGVAICLFNDIVTPLSAVLRKNRDQASRDCLNLLKQWEIDTLIVGYPKSSPDMQKRIDHFIGLLNFNGEIIKQNEDMSSIEAENLIKGDIKYKRDGRVDSIAAQIILQRYLLK